MRGSTTPLIRFANVATACLGAAAVCTTAAAQDDAAVQTEAAKDLFEAGRTAYVEERYEEALDYFERSYELSPQPELLYNIAMAAHRMDDPDRAIEALERYRTTAPKQPEATRSRLEERIERLLQRLEEENRRQSERDNAAPAQPAADETRTPGPFEGRLFTWIALGVGAASGAVATYFWLDAKRTYDDLQQRCGSAGCSKADVDASGGPRRLTLSRVFLATSLVAAAGAVGLYFLEAPGVSGDGELSVGLGPGGLTLRRTF